MSWWQDKLHQLSSDSYLTRNKSHSTHSRDATRRIPPLIQRVHHFPPDLRVKEPRQWVLASSVLYVSQFSLSAMSNSLWPHGLQHTRLPWPSPTPRVYSNSCPLSPSLITSLNLLQWCHLKIKILLCSSIWNPALGLTTNSIKGKHVSVRVYETFSDQASDSLCPSLLLHTPWTLNSPKWMSSLTSLNLRLKLLS